MMFLPEKNEEALHGTKDPLIFSYYFPVSDKVRNSSCHLCIANRLLYLSETQSMHFLHYKIDSFCVDSITDI